MPIKAKRKWHIVNKWISNKLSKLNYGIEMYLEQFFHNMEKNISILNTKIRKIL